MNIQQGDILIRKSTEGDTLWLSERLVSEVCKISQKMFTVVRDRYKKSVPACYRNRGTLPSSGKSWRWAKINHQFYYDYACLPDRAPTHYRSKFGTESQLREALKALESDFKLSLKETQKSQIIKEVAKYEISADIQYYQFKATVLFNDRKAKELAQAKAWCVYIAKMMANEGYKQLGIATKQDFLLLCTEILEQKALEGLKVSNAHYLRNKITNFPNSTNEQLEYLINGRYGNDNARIIGKFELVDEETGQIFKFDAHEALMYYAYMSPGQSTKESIRQLYVNFYTPGIAEFGLEPVAYRTFCKQVGAFHRNVKMSRERHGVDYYKKTSLSYIPSKKLQYAHSLFAGDGSGTINYKYYNSKGELKTMKLYVILISDVASRKIVGWSVADKGQHKETSEMLEKAIKMAIENCDKQTMFEFVSDNHSAFTSAESKDLLNMVFRKVRTIEVGNSQANPAETEFRLFKQSLKGLSNFGSTSWGVGVEGQSNPDYFNIEDLPSYEDAILQFYDIVQAWNSTPLRDGVSPQKRFENKHPECKPMDTRILRKIYGNHTAVDVSYMRGFVRVAKTKGYEHREDYLFEIPNYEGEGAELIAKMTGYNQRAKVKVVWDENMADLYNLEGTFIMSCMPAELASKSHAEADEQSNRALGHHEQRKKAQMEAVDEFESSLNEIFDELPYIHQMKTGGNKESFNGAMEQGTEKKIKQKSIKKQLIEKDFDQNW